VLELLIHGDAQGLKGLGCRMDPLPPLADGPADAALDNFHQRRRRSDWPVGTFLEDCAGNRSGRSLFSVFSEHTA
jgi:hypothetical protein